MSARFIETPHLPQGKVGLCALGEKYRENLEKPLKNLGMTPFWLPENRAVDPRLSGHATSCCYTWAGTGCLHIWTGCRISGWTPLK